MKVHIDRFHSIREFADAAIEGNKRYRKETGSQGVSSSRRNDPEFYGETKTLKQAHDLAVNGWKRGADDMQAFVSGVEPRMQEFIAERDVYAPDVMGDFWDVGDLNAGIPECFFRPVSEEAFIANRTVTLLLGLTYNWTVSSEVINYRGALVLAAIEAFARSGFEMEVWGEMAVHRSYGEHDLDAVSTLIRLKAAGEPVDVRSYSYATEPGFFRRLGFAVMEGWPHDRRQGFGVHKDGGYGAAKGCLQRATVGATMVFDFGGDDEWPRYAYDEQERQERGVEWLTKILSDVGSQRVIGGAV